MKIVQTIIFSFTIWVVAALINAALSATILSFSGSRFESWPGAFVLALVFSLLFSAPGIFVFWIIFMACVNSEKLFGILLRTGILASLISVILFRTLLNNEFKGLYFFMGLSAVIDAVIAILVHHTSITSINKNEK
ncbi:hypothetical protein LK994_06800 [Ferruginibacter lapsinanis]|uniref:hypothetical protein n=1 Tax=Ferruginibacter lapsinanis TaxID=563172 RepID=UPI001E2D948D|nr:hypothetical protein [Ferruginibacter lapsinanis]UEG51182.1 hypothetical protein LK994_06800 [Ferruginibacter lapsinanis]